MNLRDEYAPLNHLQPSSQHVPVRALGYKEGLEASPSEWVLGERQPQDGIIALTCVLILTSANEVSYPTIEG